MSTHKRFWEIDVLRTVAVAMMVTFHALYLLEFFGIRNTGVLGACPYEFWWCFPRVTGGMFIFLAGVSLTISQARGKRISGFMMRGLKIFGCGMAITLITLLISRTDWVRFGILHFFGIAFILAPFFLGFRFINLIVGVAAMTLGICLQGVSLDLPWLLWLIPHSFTTWDYWPLLPWFGLLLVGMFAGKMSYPEGNRRFPVPEFSNRVTSALTLPGRHPLAAYFAQWPLIIGVLLALYPANVLPYFPPLPF
jgi:uncharacterized membrane protein